MKSISLAAAEPAAALAGPLRHVIDRLHAEPSRTWSLIVTVFGDAILPRGGSVWLGTLIRFCEAIGVGGGVVRTAMSRLAADGWVDRNRVGRNSFYRLSPRGEVTFREAAGRIYDPHPPDWSGEFELLLAGNGLSETERA
ncbi:MAG TPA: hypothetical protein VKS60_10730, partial [Stellaceae bacterium]|nr:hypothetical protein [Stellaceae bacterium]